MAADVRVANFFVVSFRRRTPDSLFAPFALAFWPMALNQALVTLQGIPREEQS